MHAVHGLHHITVIAGPAQENLDFYAGILGMRLVKRSINQDDPGTYHLFYTDAAGHPGTDLTFFPWSHMAPPRLGHGLAVEIGLEVPGDSLDWWGVRLQRYGFTAGAIETRFGDRVLPLSDPHGVRLTLTESARTLRRVFSPWDGSPIPVERQIRGLYGARLWEREQAPTARFLTGALGFRELGRDGEWTRYGFPEASGVVDIRETPDERRGAWGVGAVHHLAWTVEDLDEELAIRAQIEAAGGHATEVIDRFWFKSVYFKEPGGVLFELATRGPGFAVDEDPSHLGESLVLPPWYEPSRTEIERVLPPLSMPGPKFSVPEPK
jgi:glyoxalase family protein